MDNSFGVNEGNDALIPPPNLMKKMKMKKKKKPRLDDQRGKEWECQHCLQQQQQQQQQHRHQLPLPEQLLVSERPPQEEEVYSPKPLTELEVRLLLSLLLLTLPLLSLVCVLFFSLRCLQHWITGHRQRFHIFF